MSDCVYCPADPENPKEFYKFFNKVWDVDLAKKLIKDGNYEVGFVTRDQLEKMGLVVNPEPNVIYMCYSPNEEHLLHIPKDKLGEPAIFAPFWTDTKADALFSYAMIDGTHRATIKLRDGEDRVNAYLLTEEDSKKCCIRGWAKPRKKSK